MGTTVQNASQYIQDTAPQPAGRVVEDDFPCASKSIGDDAQQPIVTTVGPGVPEKTWNKSFRRFQQKQKVTNNLQSSVHDILSQSTIQSNVVSKLVTKSAHLRLPTQEIKVPRKLSTKGLPLLSRKLKHKEVAGSTRPRKSEKSVMQVNVDALQICDYSLFYACHTICIPQNVQQLCTDLPRLPQSLNIVVLRSVGRDGACKDFRIRRDRVLNALLHLIEHHKYFHNFNINIDNLSQLPEDGIFNFSSHEVDKDDDVIEEQCVSCSQEESCGSTQQSSRNDLDEHGCEDDKQYLPSAFIPLNVNVNKDSKIIGDFVQGIIKHDKAATGISNLLAMPDRDYQHPVNEFRTEGFIVMAFPTIFASGEADLNAAGGRQIYVTPIEYFKHLMKYKDGRFARYPRFCYFALNSKMRRQALSSGRVYLKQNLNNANLTTEDMEGMSDQEMAQFVKRITRFGNNKQGNPAFWKSKKSELITMIEMQGRMPTHFVTFSAAGLHCPA